VPEDDSIVLTTKQNVYFLERGVSEYKLKPITGWGAKTSQIQACLSIGFVDYDAVIGTLKGDLLRLKGSHLVEKVTAHKGAVYAICTLDKNQGVITGGQDGKVLFWDNKLTVIRTFDLSSLAKGSVHNPAIRAITDNPSRKSIAVGTRSGEILELYTDGTMRVVMNSHSEREVWGLAAYPDSVRVATCGDDHSLMVWDIAQKKLKQKKKIPYKALCCDVTQKVSAETLTAIC
jgi:WD40 repeat protein